MTFQSTIASIQNIRKQRQLELELVDLERKWHVELKVIARERLGLVKELCRIQQEQRARDHFHASMHGKDLARFTDRAQGRLQQARELKQLHKFNFQPDPVEKMSLHLPLIRDDASGDVGKVFTSKELYKHRIQLQKSNFEQCMADRRSRRRPFWDKAIIETKSKEMQRNRKGIFRQRARMFGLVGPLQQSHVSDDSEAPGKRGDSEEDHDDLAKPEEPSRDTDDLRHPGELHEDYDDLRTHGRLSKSPSLPALNTLRRLDPTKPKPIHPSLSSRHSASMDYLPVIKGTRGQHGLFTSLKAPSISSSVSTLPTITEA